MDVDATESALRNHFAQLRDAKSFNGVPNPVFALEHCLELEQVGQLATGLSDSIRREHAPLEQHWVCWVVHAAEQGYDFNGQEYWDSFAQRTPGWALFQDRELLRSWFCKFHRKYGGASPEGAWSERYGYIKWPVTHALLPRDLQVQLAESIYNARYNMDIAPGLDPESLGQLVARYTYGGSSRYKGFLQQPALVGRIVQALLQQDGDGQSPIYRPTLERITGDLMQRAQAREWLSDARTHYASASVRMVSGQRRQAEAPAIDAAPNTPDLSFSLAPHFRMTRVGQARWATYVCVPSFQALCMSYPEYRVHLDQHARFQIAGSSDTAIPARALLSGQPRERRLVKWPADNERILHFSPPLEPFDRLVSTECVVPPTSLWLFKVTSANNAEFLPGAIVRPNQEYIVLSRELGQMSSLGESIEVDCEGVEGVLMHLPAVVSAEQRDTLHRLGLRVRQTITVTPIGLAPRCWTDDGYGEWLTSEHPSFLLEHNHEFASYAIALDEETPVFARWAADRPTYVFLERLSAGRHTLAIATYDGATDMAHPHGHVTAHCKITLFVRNPATWVPGVLCHEAFVVDVNLEQPSLDDFLSERLQIHVEGDRARKVTCSLVLLNAGGHILHREQIFQHFLPIDVGTWSKHLHRFLVAQSKDYEWLAAASGYICIDSPDLGEHRVQLTTQCNPLRWAVRKSNGHTHLRLIDEGAEPGYEVRHRAFRTPCDSVEQDASSLLKGIDVSQGGGLFTIVAPGIVQSAVIDVPQRGDGFGVLGAGVDTRSFESVRDLEAIMNVWRLWFSARASSTGASIKQSQVVRAIHRHLAMVVCGSTWARAEDELRTCQSDRAWAQLERAIGSREWFSYAVSLTRVVLTENSGDVFMKARHTDISLDYRLSIDGAFAQTCWSIANRLEETLNTVLDWDSIAADEKSLVMFRGARLLYLCKEYERGIKS